MRPRWVEVRGHLALIVREGPGSVVLIRYASRRGEYHTVHRTSVVRRADLDGSPEPAWLQHARASARPPRVLWSLLHGDEAPPSPEPMFETDADGRPLEGAR